MRSSRSSRRRGERGRGGRWFVAGRVVARRRKGLRRVETALDPGAARADSGVVGDGTVHIRFDGITASAPMTARRALASKALSAGRAPPARPSSRVSASLTSPRWPAVTTGRSGRPNASAAPWRNGGAAALAARRAARSGLPGALPDKSAGGAARRDEYRDLVVRPPRERPGAGSLALLFRWRPAGAAAQSNRSADPDCRDRLSAP